MGAVVVTDLPSDPSDLTVRGSGRRGGGTLTAGSFPGGRDVWFAKPNPCRIGASLGGGVGLPTFRAYTEWIGRDDMIAVDYFARAQWSDIENPSFIFTAWAPWQAAYPDNWIALAVPLLPDSLNPATAQNWTDGANGVHDAHFNTLADNIIASGIKNIILRLHHEFNLTAIPGGSLANWVTYWKRVVNLLRVKFTNATGVRMMTCWNPTNNITTFDLDAMWPGKVENNAPTDFGGLTGNPLIRVQRGYPFRRRFSCPEVDFIGIDCYDQNGSSYVNGVQPTAAQHSEAWWSYLTNFDEFNVATTPINTSSLNYMATLARETGTPLCVPEWGCWGVGQGRPAGGDNPTYIRKMREWLLANNVSWACYFDWTNVGLDAHHQLWPGLANTIVTQFPLARDEYMRLF